MWESETLSSQKMLGYTMMITIRLYNSTDVPRGLTLAAKLSTNKCGKSNRDMLGLTKIVALHIQW